MIPNKSECCMIWYHTRMEARRMARVHVVRTSPTVLPWVFKCSTCDGWHFGSKEQADRLAIGNHYAAFTGRSRS